MILRFIVLLFLALNFSCTSNDATIETEALGTEDSNQCFDLKMEQWYISFHKYQEQGMDMFEADKRAMEDAVKGYESCQQAYGKQIASESK